MMPRMDELDQQLIALLRGNAFSDETVMTHRIPLCIALLSLLAMTSSAVAQFTVASGQQVTPAPTLERGAELPLLTVHKHPSCGCCGVCPGIIVGCGKFGSSPAGVGA